MDYLFLLALLFLHNQDLWILIILMLLPVDKSVIYDSFDRSYDVRKTSDETIFFLFTDKNLIKDKRQKLSSCKAEELFQLISK